MEFLDYLNAPAKEAERYTTTEKVRRLHEGIVKLKKSKEVKDRYMSLWETIEDYKEKAWAEGRAAGMTAGLKEGREEGRAGQIVEMGLEFGLSMSEILSRLQQKLGISLSEAEKYFCIYSKEATGTER